MAEPTDPTAAEAFVGQIVDQATGRLNASAADAQARHEQLTQAAKDPGNALRSAQIDASLETERRLVVDANALAQRLPSVQETMVADLQRLLVLALKTNDGAG